MAIQRIFCPNCGRSSASSDAFCGQCRYPLQAHVAIMNNGGAGQPIYPPMAGSGPAQSPIATFQPGMAIQPPGMGASSARPRLLGLWPEPQTTGEWVLWLIQGFAPLGALLVLAFSYPSWVTPPSSGSPSPSDFPFRVISAILGFTALGVWTIVNLYRGMWKHPRGWLAATGCLAAPALLVVSIVGAFIILAWVNKGSASFQAYAVCIGGLMPLAAVMYFVMRGKTVE